MLSLVKLSKIMNESKQEIQNWHLTSLQPKEEKFKMFFLFPLSIKLFLTKELILKKRIFYFWKIYLDFFIKLISNLNFYCIFQ